MVSKNYVYIFSRPGGRADSPGSPDDKRTFALLIQEMRVEYDKHGLMLTAAVSAGEDYINNGYDVPVMAATLDIIALMTYDFHGW
jgi:chitinase